MTVETGPISSRLLELQTIDREIRRIRDQIAAFGPLLEEVDAEARALAEKVQTTEKRVQELHVEERSRRRSAEEKRDRVKSLEERLELVRTVREESAVQAELGFVRRSADSEEQEVFSLLDQISRLEERLGQERQALDDARQEVKPRQDQLIAERGEAETALATLEQKRGNCAAVIEPRYLRVYENLNRGGRRTAVASMTEDGACGVCFSMIPPQLQNEIRTSAPLVLCEACGIIVTAPESGTPAEEDSGSAE